MLETAIYFEPLYDPYIALNPTITPYNRLIYFPHIRIPIEPFLLEVSVPPKTLKLRTLNPKP